ncbi:MAG: hypothetical protein GC205_08600 [Bacteroidetes bacterium]|nr:hypothetical protein [Bacteroidota bacterium]
MKATFVLSVLLGVLTTAANAQLTLTSADFPATGQTYRISLADTLLAIDPAPTGEDFTWDFSFLEPVSQSEEGWVTPFETNILYFFLFGTSNMAQELSLPVIPGLELTDAFNFYQRNSGAFSQTGLAGLFTGIPIVIAFEDADRIAAFPLTYGSIDSDASAFEFEVPTLAALREERQRESLVDGWGTLITPYGTFDVLRQIAILNIRDSLSGSLGEFVLERQTIEYRWLGAGTGVPLLQIDVQVLGETAVISRIAYQDSLRSVEPPVGLTTPLLSNAQLFPNPAQNQVWLQGTTSRPTEMSLQLLDALGRTVRTWPPQQLPAGNFSLPLNLNGCSAGLYWLHAWSGAARSGEGIPHFVQPLLIE